MVMFISLLNFPFDLFFYQFCIANRFRHSPSWEDKHGEKKEERQIERDIWEEERLEGVLVRV